MGAIAGVLTRNGITSTLFAPFRCTDPCSQLVGKLGCPTIQDCRAKIGSDESCNTANC